MKSKQILALLLCLALALCGCSANSVSKDYAAEYPSELNKSEGVYYESTEITGEADSAGALSSAVLSNRKLIRRVSISAETEDMDALLNGLTAHIASLGGYVESRNVHNGSAYSGKRYRSATLVIRIPAEQLDGFVQQVGETSNIVSTNESSDDVTLQYVDTESRLKVLRTEEERLLKFLSEATNVSEMLEVEKRLTQVQADIESLTAQLKTYDNLISYSTVTLNISEVTVYTPTGEPTLWQRISSAFGDSVKGLGSIFQGLLVFLLGYSPYLMFYALIVGGIVLVIWSTQRKKKKKAAAKKNEAAQ